MRSRADLSRARAAPDAASGVEEGFGRPRWWRGRGIEERGPACVRVPDSALYKSSHAAHRDADKLDTLSGLVGLQRWAVVVLQRQQAGAIHRLPEVVLEQAVELASIALRVDLGALPLKLFDRPVARGATMARRDSVVYIVVDVEEALRARQGAPFPVAPRQRFGRRILLRRLVNACDGPTRRAESARGMTMPESKATIGEGGASRNGERRSGRCFSWSWEHTQHGRNGPASKCRQRRARGSAHPGRCDGSRQQSSRRPAASARELSGSARPRQVPRPGRSGAARRARRAVRMRGRHARSRCSQRGSD